MEKDITLEYAAFLRSFKRNIDVPHSFLLGAGASISSGVQSAYDCIWEWKKDIFLSAFVFRRRAAVSDKTGIFKRNDRIHTGTDLW